MNVGKRQCGFSFIETIIAATVLSVAVIPILGGFYQASRNQRFALVNYRAQSYAQSLLIEAEAALSRSSAPDSSDDIRLLIDGFDKNYDTDSFLFRVSMHSYPDGESSVYSDSESLAVVPPSPILTSDMPVFAVQPNAATGSVYTINYDYDNGFDPGGFTGGAPGAPGAPGVPGAVTIAGSNGNYILTAYVPDITAAINIIETGAGNGSADTLNILCINKSSGTIFIDFYSDNDAAFSKINLSYINAPSITTRFMKNPSKRKTFLLTAEVFNKDTKLIKRLTRVVNQ